VSKAFTLPPTHRVRSRTDFGAVFDAKVRQARGPIMLYARPNGLDHPRLGLAVPRRVGTAVRRNRIKRLLRESFRLKQHDLPAGFDLIVVVRPHAPLELAEYQRLLCELAARLAEQWRERGSRP
jgi:ribonuclease P protein component